MKLDQPKIWIAFFSALAVTSIAIVDRNRTSPGPLAAPHGLNPELAQSNSCSQCHGGWTRSMTSSCLDCHEPIAAQLERDEGLHGLLDETAVSHCAACHSDHHGAEFQLVNTASFKKAGFDGVEGFDHGFIGFEMAGKHLELGCAECHEYAEDLVLQEGAQRYLGLDQDCASCHEDPHEGAMALDCAACHSQETFEQQHSLGHEDYLPLIGGHADLSCRQCHAEDGLHALEGKAKPGRAASARGCTDCHQSPHDEQRLNSLAGWEGLSLETSCSVCHVPEHEQFDQPGVTVTDRQHAALGFALDDPHMDLECAACHDPNLSEFAERHPGRDQLGCAECHADPHLGQFDDVLASGRPFGAAGCTACHSQTAFAPHGFDLDRHARAGLPLEGTHAGLECSVCHSDPAPGEARQFDGTPTECAACHQDAHRGFFDPFLADLAPVEHGACALCHATTEFADLIEPGFDHAAHTPFPLDGAHAQGDCASCHQPLAEPDETARSFGFACDPLGSLAGCVSCHSDPHEGSFDREKLPAEVQGRVACERCHDQSSFRSLPYGFDHHGWTGFPLDGAHEQASCSACHAPMRATQPGGRTWQPAAGTNCAACHQDSHAGQFASPTGATDCQACHGDTSSFANLQFDHDVSSRFPLEGAHEKVACASCHEPETVNGVEVVRYKPLGVECMDCHTIQPGSLRSQLGGR